MLTTLLIRGWKHFQSSTHLLAQHVHYEGPALLMDIPSGLMEGFQEFPKLLGNLVCVEAGSAADGRTGGPAFLGV